MFVAVAKRSYSPSLFGYDGSAPRQQRLRQVQHGNRGETDENFSDAMLFKRPYANA